jgi:hypothetical protein
MRYAKNFLAAFSIAFAVMMGADALKQEPARNPNEASIVYPDGTVVTVRRKGYQDVV